MLSFSLVINLEESDSRQYQEVIILKSILIFTEQYS